MRTSTSFQYRTTWRILSYPILSALTSKVGAARLYGGILLSVLPETRVERLFYSRESPVLDSLSVSGTRTFSTENLSKSVNLELNDEF